MNDARLAEQRVSAPLIQSYVWHEDQCYSVSTIDRDSSAAAAPGRYAETMVWEFDWEKRERGALVKQGDGPESRIGVHLAICVELFENGLKGLQDDVE